MPNDDDQMRVDAARPCEGGCGARQAPLGRRRAARRVWRRSSGSRSAPRNSSGADARRSHTRRADESPSVREVGRAGARHDGAEPELPPPHGVRRRAAARRGVGGNARGKTLICLFQRGAADALNVVVPHGEAAYYRLRPQHRDRAADAWPAARRARSISTDSSGCTRRSRRSSRCGIAVMLAPVHAVGSPSSTRSHFDAQDYMETRHARPEGHARRLAQSLPRDAGHVRGRLRARRRRRRRSAPSSMTQQTPRILEGPQPTIAMNSLDEFSVRASGPAGRPARGAVSHRQRRRRARRGRRDVRGGEDPPRGEPAAVSRRGTAPSIRASQFGQRLQQIAQLIKADVGLEVAFADVGGWDTHVNQGGAHGPARAAARRLRARRSRRSSPTSATAWPTS